MSRRRNLILGGSLVAAIALLGMVRGGLESVASVQMVEAPMFEVDPFWPKPPVLRDPGRSAICSL